MPTSTHYYQRQKSHYATIRDVHEFPHRLKSLGVVDRSWPVSNQPRGRIDQSLARKIHGAGC